MKTRNRLIAVVLAVIAALGLGVGTALEAQAVTDRYSCHQYGGQVRVTSTSDANLWSWASGCGYGTVYKGHSSREYYNLLDLDKFWIKSMWYCRSQWGHDYIGYGSLGGEGSWYALENDSVSLVLDCHPRGI